MDPQTITISDSESNNLNNRLQKVHQSTIDLNIKAEIILSSTDSDRSSPDLEVECVGKIRVASRESMPYR